MKRIAHLVYQIDDELCGAKEYAEEYVQLKASGNMSLANNYKDMANDELRHAMMIHKRATEDIEQIGKVFIAPAEMQKTWDDSHVDYVERTAWIKQMLSM